MRVTKLHYARLSRAYSAIDDLLAKAKADPKGSTDQGLKNQALAHPIDIGTGKPVTLESYGPQGKPTATPSGGNTFAIPQSAIDVPILRNTWTGGFAIQKYLPIILVGGFAVFMLMMLKRR